MLDHVNRFDRNTLVVFAKTQHNYRKYLLTTLWEQPFLNKMLVLSGMKKISLQTDQDIEDIFDDALVKQHKYDRFYKTDSDLHSSKIKELEYNYEKFLKFSNHVLAQNLTIEPQTLIIKSVQLEERFQQEWFSEKSFNKIIKKILDRLEQFPLPFSDLCDILEVILDTFQDKWFIWWEKQYVIKNFIESMIPNIYEHWLNNPAERNQTIKSIKKVYKDITREDVMKWIHWPIS